MWLLIWLYQPWQPYSNQLKKSRHNVVITGQVITMPIPKLFQPPTRLIKARFINKKVQPASTCKTMFHNLNYATMPSYD